MKRIINCNAHGTTRCRSQTLTSRRARRLPVPNMIADLDQAPTERAIKPVWRVAFFGRLEERKGIKLFVDAVERLPAEARAANPSPVSGTLSLQWCMPGAGLEAWSLASVLPCCWRAQQAMSPRHWHAWRTPA